MIDFIESRLYEYVPQLIPCVPFKEPYTPLNGCQRFSRCQGVCIDMQIHLLMYIILITDLQCESIANPHFNKGGYHTSTTFFSIQLIAKNTTAVKHNRTHSIIYYYY